MKYYFKAASSKLSNRDPNFCHGYMETTHNDIKWVIYLTSEYSMMTKIFKKGNEKEKI